MHEKIFNMSSLFSVMLKPFDCHCHLDASCFNQDRTRIIQEAKRELSGVMNCGTDHQSNIASLDLASKYSHFIYAALAIHPTEIVHQNNAKLQQWFDFIEQNISNAVAVGECGLDFACIKKKTLLFEQLKQKQQNWFIKHIKLAKEYSKAIIVHSRWAATKALNLLIQHNAEKVVLHGFITKIQDYKRAIEYGYKISIATNILYNEKLQAVVAKLQPDDLLVETDSPFMFRQQNKYERNIPVNVWLVAKKLAEIFCTSQTEIIKKTNKNVMQLFGIYLDSD